jgi:hypothetical protein
MLRFAQLHIENKRAASNPRTLNNLNAYNRTNARNVKNMTLLLQQDDLSNEVNTVEKIRAVYSGKVEIVSAQEISNAIEERRAGTAVLHQVGPGETDNQGRSYRQIYGTEDAKLYYFRGQVIKQRRPAGMLLQDFRAIR